MSRWLEGLDRAERDELYLDACLAFKTNVINEIEFIQTLTYLGYNATDIEDCVKEHRPEGP